MRKKSSWIVVILFIMYVFAAGAQAVVFARVDSPINIFYHILIAYDAIYLTLYIPNALSVILNVFAIVPFWLYMRRVPWLSAEFWRLFFVLRLAMDLTGRRYEMKILTALAHQDTVLIHDAAGIMLLFLLPSYVLLYKYAFTTAVFPSSSSEKDI